MTIEITDEITDAAVDAFRAETHEVKAVVAAVRAALRIVEQRGRNRAVNAIKEMPAYLGDEGWDALADKAAEAGYDRRMVLRRRRPDDNFTALTIEAAYQHGYRTAADVALKATRPSFSEGGDA